MSVDYNEAYAIVKTMNEVLALDSALVELMVNTRIPCDKPLADHSSVQVSVQTYEDGAIVYYRVGLLGILNGIAGSFDEGDRKGHGPIVATMNLEDGTISSFHVQNDNGDVVYRDEVQK
jgi:hypothetical protein